jgi:hypothetical protein
MNLIQYIGLDVHNDSIAISAGYPDGIMSFSPGLARSAYPGCQSQNSQP